MKLKALCVAVSLLAIPGVSAAQFDSITKAAGNAGKSAVEKRVNTRLMDEGRKNQCSFKTGTAELDAGCDAKLKKLASALIDAKKQLDGAGVKSGTGPKAAHAGPPRPAPRSARGGGRGACPPVRGALAAGRENLPRTVAGAAWAASTFRAL